VNNKYKIVFYFTYEIFEGCNMKQLFIISFALIFTLSACSRDNHDHPSDISNKELFIAHCSECHGPGGTGSILLGVPSNRDTELLNIQVRHKIIKGSGGNSKMPIFHDMPEKEANRIITYLRNLPQ